jgi:hypothetical protein
MAALGPCSKTLPSVRSGVRCYVAFAGIPCVSRVRFRSMLAIRRAHCSNLRRHVEIVLSAAIALTSGLVSMFSLSPNLRQLRWLRAHILPCVGRRCAGASHCDATLSSIVLVYWQVFRHPLVQRAGFSVRALGGLRSRPKRFIRRWVARIFLYRFAHFLRARKLVEAIVGAAVTDDEKMWARLFSISYAFLLRVPSEAIMMAVGCASEEIAGQSILSLDSSKGEPRVVLRLASRKNKKHGSVLFRSCWCKDSPFARLSISFHFDSRL